MKRSLTLFAAMLAVAALLSTSAFAQCGGCEKTSPTSVENWNDGEANGHAKKDIVDTAVSAGSFKTLVAAAKAAGLAGALKGKGPFTVFAPTDEAFARLPEGTVEGLLKPENKHRLQAILKYHVVPTSLVAKDVVRLTAAKSLNGQQINIVASKKGVKVDGASVVKTDIQCSNGVIHVIDRVILPSSMNVVETAMKASTLETLVTAVKAAGLAEALMGKGPFTVLAPTNAAFAKLPEGTVESLLQPENRAKLQAILKHHVIPARAFARDAVTAGCVKTLGGTKVSFSLKDGQLLVNGARVLRTDIDATNGVIHVIDTVLLP